MKETLKSVVAVAGFVAGLALSLYVTVPVTPVGGPEPTELAEAPPRELPTLSPQELFERVAPSVFVVEAVDEYELPISRASAVAVTPNLLVTNRHFVLAGLESNEFYAFRAIQGENDWLVPLVIFMPGAVGPDLCLLQAYELSAKPVEVRRARTLQVGERVYAIGAPRGLELSLSEGIVAGLRPGRHKRRPLIQTTAAISPGSSGGGLFDAQGRLVGITTAFLRESQNINFAESAGWISDILAVYSWGKGADQ